MGMGPGYTPYRAGAYYLDLRRKVPVKVLRRKLPDRTMAFPFRMDPTEGDSFMVEHVVTGEIYARRERDLGKKQLTEMEVLAWAAQ